MVTKYGNPKAQLNSRIKQIRSDVFGGSNKLFANQIGEIEQTLSQICLGKRNVGPATLNRIITKVDGLNVEWLMTGNGQMLKQPASEVLTQIVSKTQTHLQNISTDTSSEIAQLKASNDLLMAQLKTKDDTIAELISKVAVLQYQLARQQKHT